MIGFGDFLGGGKGEIWGAEWGARGRFFFGFLGGFFGEIGGKFGGAAGADMAVAAGADRVRWSKKVVLGGGFGGLKGRG